MNKLSSLKILDKKIINLFNICDIVSIIFCFISFIFTYFYFKTFNYAFLKFSFLLFQTALSIKTGSFISAIIIQNNIK